MTIKSTCFMAKPTRTRWAWFLNKFASCLLDLTAVMLEFDIVIRHRSVIIDSN